MSGKAYTMKEMKAIVDYLTERRAYGEIRGRKMWMEFEKSKFTDRTWQSLKETFLKRILPDIHNPYYQLSLTQISSFRQGYDVQSKLGNKLEMRSVSEESDTKVEKPLNTEQPSTSNKEENKKTTGEETINSKSVTHHRSSAETIILDPCYETAEDIQRDLESPKQEKENEKEKDDKSPAKSMRDFITYSEPLTPMLQEVIEDFATDEEREGSDTETQMEIAEDVNTDKNPKNSNGHMSDAPVEISSEADDMSNNADMHNEPQEIDKKQPAEEILNKNIKELEESVKTSNSKTEISTQELIEIEDTDNCDIQKNEKEPTGKHVPDSKKSKNSKEIVPTNNAPGNIANNTSEDNVKRIIKNNGEKAIASQKTCSQNDSSTTVDTLLPNNQEELNIEPVAVVSDSVKKTTSNESQPKKLTLNKNSDKNPKKRANSQEPTVSKKKRQLINESSKKIWVSDTDAGIKQNGKEKTDKAMLLASHKQKIKMLQSSSKENKKVDSLKQDVKDLQRVTEEKIDESCKKEINKGKDQEIHVDNSKNDVINSSVENPCLKSVSLYDEQFTSLKYTDSSDEAITTTTNKNIHQELKGDDKNSSDGNDVIALKSNSEIENNEFKKKKKDTPVGHVVPKSEREKALANVFGFSSGAVASSRKRRFSYQNRSRRRQSHTKISSESSEWTSETDTEFISPPRGTRNRHTKKYLKPNTARILSLEEDGGLFVMYGKKIYPLVKDGKIVKNYLTYSPERDSEDEKESYWKLKYIEEKKRTAKLAKLLSHTTDDDQQSNEKSVTYDATKPSPPKKPKLITDESESKEKKSGQEIVSKEHLDIPHPASTIDKTLKIKIMRQNEEVQLEGHWSQINPVLDHVVHIFHKEMESRTSVRSTPQPEQSKSISSGISTPAIAVPIDPEVHEKVNKLETEIFQEIEARDKQDKQSEVLPKTVQESKVTKRRPGRPRKSISQNTSRAQSLEKNPNVPMASPKLQIEENPGKLPPAKIENGTSVSLTRRTRTKNVPNESTERSDNNVINTRNKKTKELSVGEAVEDETEVRYKFPSPPPSEKKTYRKSGANKTPKQQKPINSYTHEKVGILSSPINVSINSVESSQGYQDSDISPYNICLRKKKKVSITSLYKRKNYQTRKSIRRKGQLKLDEISDQSSNSCSDFCVKSTSIQNSSLNTDVYRSDSYQLLMPKARNSFTQLAKIDEINLDDKLDSGTVLQKPNIEIVKNDQFNSMGNTNKTELGLSGNTDIENSSNISLPPSPVLSIVESISISKNALSSVEELTENESSNRDQKREYIYNDYNITDVDVTMPLMEQDCGLQTCEQSLPEPKNDCNANKSASITDSFINKICSVNIGENFTLSDTVTQKIRNLLLDSAKKLTKKFQGVEVVDDNDDKMDVDAEEIKTIYKGRSKKRCSTPRKRKGTGKVKSKKPEFETFVEEEHVETCSQEGRKSCPPLIPISSAIEYNTRGEHITTDTKLPNSKGRKKKDNIIKVKILRPRTKSDARKTNVEQTTLNMCDKSLHADSGINETESSILFQGFNDSIDLIHNHSETCLQANECVGDSVEFIESNTKSVISLDSNSAQSVEKEFDDKLNTECPQNMPCELFINNSRNTCISNANEIISSKDMESNEGTAYHTPMNSEGSPTSLMTEDLSDDVPVERSRLSKWYLFSEDETTNTNFALQKFSYSDVSYGSNLNQLFPITCAVPDLSTISELSKENDTKPIDLDGNTRNDFLSQSVFDSNFQ